MSTPDAANRDERLAGLIADMTQQQRRGQAPDLDTITKQHPDLAGELRSLWAAAQVAEAFVRPVADATVEFVARTVPGALRPQLAGPREFGDYVLLEERGRGGMGVVYKARQKSLNRIVALKMVLRGELASESDRARFRQEAEAAARLVHPNIVTVHEVGEVDGQPYFSMEFVEGATLAERTAKGPLPPREAARVVAAVARAVEHAHRQGILHRDLKPSNVLLSGIGHGSGIGYRVSGIGEDKPVPRPGPSQKDQDHQPGMRFPIPDTRYPTETRSPTPKVTDFGLAKRVETKARLTQSGAAVGTPSYMAPEQARAAKELTPAADVYSLGAVLYECLTGRPPFQAPTQMETLFLVLEQDPVPPRLLNPGMPRGLETVCLKCLEKSPARRYATAAALADDLEAFLGGEHVSAQSSGLADMLDRLMGETHHAAVLENWGVLWMWHSLWLFLLCALTQGMAWSGVDSHWAYLLLWTVGLVGWGTIFWQLRRRGGPVRFVERQIAHAWAAGVCASIGMFLIEVVMGQPPLTFSPLLAVAAGMVFLFKAGVLAGLFYVAAAAMFVTALVMAFVPQVGVLLFGVVTAACFFFPGLKYHRQRLRASRELEPQMNSDERG